MNTDAELSIAMLRRLLAILWANLIVDREADPTEAVHRISTECLSAIPQLSDELAAISHRMTQLEAEFWLAVGDQVQASLRAAPRS